MLLSLHKVTFSPTFKGLSCKIAEKIMRKGKRKLRATATWFESGHIPHNKGKKQKELNSQEGKDKKSVVYIRPTDTEMSMVQNNPIVDGEMTETDSAASGGELYKTLRPRPSSPLEVEKKNSGSGDSRLVLLVTCISCHWRLWQGMRTCKFF